MSLSIDSQANKALHIDFADIGASDRQQTVRDCQTLKKQASAFRAAFEAQMVQNAAFLAGDQYVDFAKDARLYTKNRRINIKAPGTDTKLVANKILGICWQQASYLNQNFVEETAQAPDNTQESVLRAEIATDILRSRFKDNREEERRIFDLFWLFVAGRVWRMVYYDTDATYRGFDGEVVRGVGDTVNVTLNPFKVYQSPWVDSTGEMPWLILSDVLPIDQVRQMYPKQADDLQDCDIAEAIGQMDSLLQSTVQGTMAPPRRKDAVILDRLYHVPTPDYPDGSMIIWCGDVLLDRRPLPEKEWPFVNIDWFPVPGANYPLSYIQPMVGPQRQMNFTISQMRELAFRQLSGDIAYRGAPPDGMGFKPVEHIRDPQSGSRYIRIDPAVQDYQFVTYDLRPEMGLSIKNMMGDLLLDVGAIHDQSLGKHTGPVVTATTTLALKESDMAGTSLHRDIISNAYCRSRELELRCIAAHTIVPRVLQNATSDSGPMVFVGSDIKGIDEVSVQSLPMMTDVQRRETLDRIESAGLFGPFEFPMTDPRYWEALLRGAEVALKCGVPNIESYVENRIKPFTIEGLREFIADQRRQAVGAFMSPQPQEAVPELPMMPGGPVMPPQGGGLGTAMAGLE